MQVRVESCSEYRTSLIDQVLSHYEELFSQTVKRGNSVVIKPNWIAHSHKYNPNEWQSVITHPTVITSILKVVLRYLDGKGQVTITDGPQTDASWQKIMARMQPATWIEMGNKAGVSVTVMDLRDDEWSVEGDVNIGRKKLPGDPLGSTECDLGQHSAFIGHHPSQRGYYGADYNPEETNLVHSHGHHKYKVSRTVITADVFINVPKMKTHKKAGITCSLKNLVGINTYKNWLPHHTEGTPDEGGDQFPTVSLKNKAETVLLQRFKSYLYAHRSLGRFAIPVKKMGKILFGDTRTVIRSGNWYGNQTLWRTILDLNKILLYANPDGSLREDQPSSRKKYLSIVDGIIAGEGNGPEAPDPKSVGLLVAGTNPVAVDATCAKLMGFDWRKIPSIAQAFMRSSFPLCDFHYSDIHIVSSLPQFHGRVEDLSPSSLFHFRPHFGWVNHLEL